ncbi:ATP-binding protein [Massilia sp. LXY-6]|uniref:ATP-binding protein n=1 Tax=Massilia sp. LXY-6 TaxID=3379823 RepID=UPI003EDEC172
MSFSVQPKLTELANRAPSTSQWRLVLFVLLIGIAFFIGVSPFAEAPVSAAVGIVAIHSAGLAVTNLLTALLLIAQLQMRRSFALLLLSLGYLFSSLAACAYTLLFPELISLFASINNSQANDWLYLGWHGVFSMCVLGYALTSRKPSAVVLHHQLAFLLCVALFIVIGLRSGLDTVVPSLEADRRMGGVYYTGICAALSVSVLAFAAVLQKRPRTLLDLWLSVAMLTWTVDIALAASFNNQSFDTGFYAGRLCGLLGSLFLLGVLGAENLNVHARLRSAFDGMIEARVREKSNELIAAVLRQLPEGVFIFDDDEQRSIINERGMALIGGGGGVMEMVTAQANRAAAQGAFEHEVVENIEAREQRVFSVSAAPIRTGEGKLAARVVVVSDVTERIRADKALQQYLERLHALLENTPLAAIEWGSDRIVRRWSKRAEELFGWPASDVLGKPIDALGLIHPDDTHAVDAMMDALVGSDVTYIKSENRNITRDRRVLECEWHNSALRNEKGEIDTVFSLALDVTERKQAMEQLKEADLRKDVFIATLAHELRNPLAPIANAASLLVSQRAEQERVEWLAAMISRQSSRMGRLLDDLLDVSRIGRGKVELRKELLELTGLVHEALQVSMPLIEAARHHVEVVLPDGPVWVDADPVRLAQIMSNLLNNAAKYTPPDGRIDVVMTVSEPYAVFTVSDNGIGIEPDMLPHVFEAFVQVGSARHLAQGGLGIGLSLARGLAELHGGTLTATSDGKDRGSAFTMRLPLAAGRPDASATSVADATLAGLDTTILVADDNVDAAESLAMLLRARGARVSVAYDGEQALQRFYGEPADTVILDLGMPRVDGLEVARELMQAAPRPYLIALTGRGRKEDEAESLLAGFDEHLVKPVNLDRLIGLLQRRSARSRLD